MQEIVKIDRQAKNNQNQSALKITPVATLQQSTDMLKNCH